MRKNVANQRVVCQLYGLDGKPFIAGGVYGAVQVWITGDSGTPYLASSPQCTHKKNGCWIFWPSQAETNYDHVVYHFEESGSPTEVASSVQFHTLHDVNVTQINESATAADNLAVGAAVLVISTVASGPSDTLIPSNLTEASDDHYNGRTLTFRTGVLAGQSTDITDYDGASKDLTVTQMTEAPSQGDEFVIS